LKLLTGLSQNTQGILCLVGALALLTISDSIIKWLSPYLPLHQIMLFRGVFAMVIVFLIIYFEGGLIVLRTKRPGLHFLRGSLLVLANMFFFLGLAAMPLAETVALFYTAPLFICALSQPFLGEKVGLSRWLVIIFGLAGVLVMVRPGTEVFKLVSLLPILAALSYSAMTIMTRTLGKHESAGALTFYIQLAFIVISSIVGLGIGDGRLATSDSSAMSFLLRAWQWPNIEQFQLLAICGAVVCAGGYLISQAYRLGQASVVAPFEYTSMPFALVVGYYLWGDWPDWISFSGSALIICSGLIVVYIENRTSRKLARPVQIDY
jgi:drug/metabolite transporter (DMT)-like permease